MKFKTQRGVVSPVLLFLVFAAIGVAAVMFEKQPDGPVEQFAEDGLESVLGLPPDSIDFTPPDEGENE